MLSPSENSILGIRKAMKFIGELINDRVRVMCYSALVNQDIKMLASVYGAKPKFDEFHKLFAMRNSMKGIYIPKALELAFEHPESTAEIEIKKLIDSYRELQTRELQQELFKQRKRLVDAERKLKTKVTKAAENDVRIATNKIDQLTKRISDVGRTEPKQWDTRIFPFHYSTIVVNEGSGNEILPARYHCRPTGKPEFYDRKFDGLYNARRDSLEKFWSNLFCHHHAIMQITGFYENVPLHRFERRELKPAEPQKNVVLFFNPKPEALMNVACLWSRWDESLISFAAVTDEPPPEIAAAGHDRVVITLKQSAVQPWLNTNGASPADFYRLFDDRERPFFEHRQAA